MEVHYKPRENVTEKIDQAIRRAKANNRVIDHIALSWPEVESVYAENPFFHTIYGGTEFINSVELGRVYLFGTQLKLSKTKAE